MARGAKGNYRFPYTTSQTTQKFPDLLRGHFVHFQAIGTRVQYAIVKKGDTAPTITIDASSTFDVPSEHVVPTLPRNQASREFVQLDDEYLTFKFAPPPATPDDGDPAEPYFEVWLTDVKNAGVNATVPAP